MTTSVFAAALSGSFKAQAGLTAICVIDNASTDDSVSIIRQGYPDVEILINEQNLPFGTAYNRAIAARGEDIIFLANNNTLSFTTMPSRMRSLSSKRIPTWPPFPSKASIQTGRTPFPCSCGPLRRFGKGLAPGRHSRQPERPGGALPLLPLGCGLLHPARPLHESAVR